MKGHPEDISGLLRRGAVALQLDIDEAAVARLEKYVVELLRWSKKINLIAKKQNLPQVVENHFLDSLVLLTYLQKAGSVLVDVGTGGGFPGLVVKAALPELGLILVEPRLKRVSFLRHIIRSLQLGKVEVMARRIEEVKGELAVCSHITSRAVAEVGEFLELVCGVGGVDAQILCMKGPKWREELDRAAGVLQKTGVALVAADEFTLPFSGAERAVLTFCRSG